MEIIQDLYFVPTSPGIIRCLAENKIGRTEGKAHVMIRDIEDSMTISGISINDIVARGDEVTIICSAVAYYFSDDLNWYRDGNLIETTDSKWS